jgi:hypothetical protein
MHQHCPLSRHRLDATLSLSIKEKKNESREVEPNNGAWTERGKEYNTKKREKQWKSEHHVRGFLEDAVRKVNRDRLTSRTHVEGTGKGARQQVQRTTLRALVLMIVWHSRPHLSGIRRRFFLLIHYHNVYKS